MRTRYSFLTIAVVMSVLSIHCGVTQPVRVLGDGQTQLTASLGGPFVTVKSTTFPVPYATIGVMHGVSERVTLVGNVHATAALFREVAFDAGAATCLVSQDGYVPEVTVRGQMMVFAATRHGTDIRVFPNLSINASYLVGETDLLYVGADNVFQKNDPIYLVSPFVGYMFSLGGRWSGQIETKWMGANVNTSSGVFEGHGNLSDHGNTSLFFSCLYAL